MHSAGFASIPTAQHPQDGLMLTDTFIAAAVRCAPPDNKPTPAEIATCHAHLAAETAALPNVEIIISLGRIAFDAAWRVLAERGVVVKPRPTVWPQRGVRDIRVYRDWLVSPEPAEHEYRQADAPHAGRRVPARAATALIASSFQRPAETAIYRRFGL
jgi:uracil-DNA glycosylase